MLKAIVGGRLIDGTGRDPVQDGTVVMEDDRIVAAGPESQVQVPRGAEVLDAGGRTILPGIIDCHVHSTYRARDIRQLLLNQPSFNIFKSLEILRATLECGVTTARDVGGADPGFRRAIDERIIVGPRLQVSVVMVSQTGGHGDCWVHAGYRVPKRTWLPNNIADGVNEVRKLTRELLMMGADLIKICATGGITSVTDDYDESQYTVEEIQAAVTEAKTRNKRVAVHAEGLSGIKNALRAGVYSLEHGWFLDEECVEMMIKQGTWWVPTLALVPESVKRRQQDQVWSKQALASEDRKDDEIYRRQLKQMNLYQQAIRKGLKVAMGTDQSHRLLTGENLVEMAYMMEFLGMTAMETIVASTKTAAECLERPDLGTIQAGKRADILLVDGDPLADIKVLQQPNRLHLVMKDGIRYKDLVTQTR